MPMMHILSRFPRYLDSIWFIPWCVHFCHDCFSKPERHRGYFPVVVSMSALSITMHIAQFLRDEKTYCDETSLKHIIYHGIDCAMPMSFAGKGLSLTYLARSVELSQIYVSLRGSVAQLVRHLTHKSGALG